MYLYSALHFICIIAITNSRANNESLRKTPIDIFTSKSYPTAANSSFPFFNCSHNEVHFLFGDNYHFIHFLLLASFSHQFEQVVFSWSLSDTKSLQLSRTLQSILSDLHNAVVWVVSISLITSFPNLVSMYLGTVPMTQKQFISPSFSSFTSSFSYSEYLSFLAFLCFHFVVGQYDKILPLTSSFFFFLFINSRSGLLTEIGGYAQENFIRFILGDRFWFMHILFDQILISGTIFCGSSFLPNHTCPCIHCVLFAVFSYHYHCYSLRVFHTSVSGWPFTGV